MLESSITSHPVTFSTPEQTGGEQTWTGHISDSFCGASHHRIGENAHRKMPARECTLASVADGADFVFVSLGVVYKIANQDFPALHDYAGHTVSLTGLLAGDSITVTEIVMPLAEGTKISVFGIFYEKERAAKCVELLTASEFSKDDISVLAPEILGSKDLAHDRDARAGNSTAVVTSSVAVGGTLGLVAGVGVAAIPGVGPLLAAAPFISALAGMGAGGLVGGAIDAVDAAGPPDHEARRYEGHIPEGGTLVTVHCHTRERAARAKELLAQAGARAISSSDEPAADFQAAMEAGTRQ
jgi:hypothetical protein